MGNQTDPIADFLTVIRNGVRAKKDRLTTRASNLTLRISEILKQEGYIENYKLMEEGGKRFVRLHLKYFPHKQSAIRQLKRISRPGLRRYAGAGEIRKVMGGLGLSILSTSKGLMTDKQARQGNIGGEIICEVW